ncbi:hypothetical protein Cgig2_012017 [Carnegiea gigantea]|uniref:Uncharacterized protein n=1 Tax=Carnegiea gigantea TaxID=171969 RepID=A0A9Q1QMN3_9CARY|nr:hypothetical protein Cgig2_012017 [Carnegiea gigantea]
MKVLLLCLSLCPFISCAHGYKLPSSVMFFFLPACGYCSKILNPPGKGEIWLKMSSSSRRGSNEKLELMLNLASPVMGRAEKSSLPSPLRLEAPLLGAGAADVAVDDDDGEFMPMVDELRKIHEEELKREVQIHWSYSSETLFQALSPRVLGIGLPEFTIG